MANEEVVSAKTIKTGTEMVKVWASIVDALLLQWVSNMASGDRLGMAITSVRLAQATRMMSIYFQDVGQEFINGQTELRACREAVEAMHAIVRAKLSEVGVGSEPATVQQKPVGSAELPKSDPSTESPEKGPSPKGNSSLN